MRDTLKKKSLLAWSSKTKEKICYSWIQQGERLLEEFQQWNVKSWRSSVFWKLSAGRQHQAPLPDKKYSGVVQRKCKVDTVYVHSKWRLLVVNLAYTLKRLSAKTQILSFSSCQHLRWKRRLSLMNVSFCFQPVTRPLDGSCPQPSAPGRAVFPQSWGGGGGPFSVRYWDR